MLDKNVIISIIIAVIFIAVAFVAQRIVYRASGEDTKPSSLIAGERGSDHAHASILIFIDNTILNNAWENKYMLKSDLVHLEGGNNMMIHKHAKGVTLPYFIETLGFQITNECLSVSPEEVYCEDGERKLRLIVNGEEVEDFDSYEIQHTDRIMIDFSSDNETTRRFKFNSVPIVPNELL